MATASDDVVDEPVIHDTRRDALNVLKMLSCDLVDVINSYSINRDQ